MMSQGKRRKIGGVKSKKASSCNVYAPYMDFSRQMLYVLDLEAALLQSLSAPLLSKTFLQFYSELVDLSYVPMVEFLKLDMS